MSSLVHPPLAERLVHIKLLVMDVDGVLTDATVQMGAGVETKTFHIRDGLGIVLARKHGIKIAWVSARPSDATIARAEDLKVDFLHQDKGPKVAAVEDIQRQCGVTWEETCYVGDDVVDLGCLNRAGMAVAPADAIPEARDLAHYVTLTNAGRGAIREVIELILKAQDKWDAILREYMA
jgi:3-deoxy-D-manno-octulosonate 8-phosphate phosphatase (KDO 8-P phosphatase)